LYGYLGKHKHNEKKYHTSPSATTSNLLRKREAVNANDRSGGSRRRGLWDLRARKDLNVVDTNPSQSMARARIGG